MRRIFRNFWYALRHSQGASTLNVCGLSVAFAVFTAVLIQVGYEYTYNGSFPKKDRIYRFEMWDDEYSSYVPIPLAGMICQSIPELSHGGVIKPTGGDRTFMVMKENGSQEFYQERVSYADTGIVSLFDFSFVEGNAEEALSVKHRLLLPESVAHKWFGEKSAVGRIVQEGNTELTIGAVYRDLPDNSSIKNMIYSWDFNNGEEIQNWNYNLFYEIDPGIDSHKLARKIAGLPEFKDYFSDEIEAAEEAGLELIKFRPLGDLYYTREGENLDGGNKIFTGLLLTTGILILFIALVNFLNFSIALAPVRMRELNTQRTFGASVSFLRRCALGEAALFTFVSFLFGLGICWFMSYTVLQSLIPISLNPFLHPGICVLAGIIAVLAGVAAGVYPAFYMTAFSPALVLKGSQALSPRGVLLRNSLMVFQFVVSVVLITSVLFIGKQMHMLKNRPWGLDKENVVYLRANSELSQQRDAFFNELRTSPSVLDLTYASSMLGEEENTQTWGITMTVENEKKQYDLRVNMVAPNFLRFFGISLLEGEDFRDTVPWRAVINETMVKKYGLEDPLSFKLSMLKIQGVVKDFNYFTLQYGIEPLAIAINENYSGIYYYIRINPADRQGALEHIRRITQQFSPATPFEVRYLDDGIQQLYEKETRLGQLIRFFGAITILIALMGVYGLVLLNARFKAREIGIRKVNGASSLEMMRMLDSSFIRLIVLAFLIACPISWYAVSRWLEGFAYRTGLSVWVFCVAGLMIAAITLLTISWQSWKAANRNPVETLKSE